MATAAEAPPRKKIVLVKERLWEVLSYVPHQGQQKVHRSKARHRVVDAGRRTGKSVIGGHELTPEALLTKAIAPQLMEQGQRREFWIVGPEYSDSEKEFRVVYNDLKRMEAPFDKPGTYNNPESGDMHISLWDGAFKVAAMSAKYPSTLVGEGLSGVVMAEAAKLKRSVWTKYIRPTLADFRGWSLHLSTPEGKNWFYEAYQAGQDPNRLDWASWRMPSFINNFVFPKGGTMEGVRLLQDALRANIPLTPQVIEASGVDTEIVDMMLDMSEEKFNQEVLGDFTEFVGRVFKEFDEEVHVGDLKYDPRYPVYLAIDYGWTNPFVCLFIQVDVWGAVTVIDEYRRVRRDINDIGDDLAAHPLVAARKCVKMYPDPAEPGDTALLVKKLKVPASTNTGGELKHRLEYIRQALKVGPLHARQEEQAPKLKFDRRRCKGTIFEMNEYRYPEDKEDTNKEHPEKPLDKDDHGPEALGRFYRGHYGPLSSGTGRARAKVKKANLG
jgi:hypothetical protein